MKELNVAILGCGTVGGGVAKILTEMDNELSQRSSSRINLKKIVELSPKTASEKYGVPLDLFCGDGKDLTKEQATRYIDETIGDENIHLIVETIGGSNDFIENICLNILKAGKHLVTANKALLAERGNPIYKAAQENQKIIGFEAAVCGAIPIIKTIKESFSGDKVMSISGIMNGTSNYILTKMQQEGLSFEVALKQAQDNGYAEADPTLDISGGDAGHKLIILMKLAFGLDVTMGQLSIRGVQDITPEDIAFAREIDCSIKLICFAKKLNGSVYATVSPMMVKNNNFLADIDGATNAVNVINKYSGKQVLVGAGAGSLETASSIVADIVFISRYAGLIKEIVANENIGFVDAKHFQFPYIVTFETEDIPGITGLVTTAIGEQNINIDTVSHNMHKTDKAIFSVATMPCTLQQIEDAVESIKKKNPKVLTGGVKVIPILY
jgi:homoserine dehydrogenase